LEHIVDVALMPSGWYGQTDAPWINV